MVCIFPDIDSHYLCKHSELKASVRRYQYVCNSRSANNQLRDTPPKLHALHHQSQHAATLQPLEAQVQVWLLRLLLQDVAIVIKPRGAVPLHPDRLARPPLQPLVRCRARSAIAESSTMNRLRSATLRQSNPVLVGRSNNSQLMFQYKQFSYSSGIKLYLLTFYSKVIIIERMYYVFLVFRSKSFDVHFHIHEANG